MAVIEARGLSKRFGRSAPPVLDGLTFSVEEGEVFGLLGPNGAGKTTTLHLLLDFIHPTAGDALLFGHPASDPRTRRRIGYLPESLSLHSYYRGTDLLHFYGALLDMPVGLRTERVSTLLRLLGIDGVARQRVSTYSKGTLQRFGFAQALLNDPDLLILDEPTSSLDPLARHEFSQVLRTLKERGKTILVSSHLLSEVEVICDRVAIVVDGTLARMGRLDELLATDSVRLHVRELPADLIQPLLGTGAEVALGGDDAAVRVRCPSPAVREAVVAALDARRVPIERVESETRSLEELFVETVRRGEAA